MKELKEKYTKGNEADTHKKKHGGVKKASVATLLDDQKPAIVHCASTGGKGSTANTIVTMDTSVPLDTDKEDALTKKTSWIEKEIAGKKKELDIDMVNNNSSKSTIQGRDIIKRLHVFDHHQHPDVFPMGTHVGISNDQMTVPYEQPSQHYVLARVAEQPQ